MSTFFYDAFNDELSGSYQRCNRKSDALPMLINCAGRMELDYTFTTYNEQCRDDYYLIYITAGELVVEIDGNERVCGVGSYIIFPPHYGYKYSSRNKGIDYYFVHFTGSFVDILLTNELSLPLPYIGTAGISEEIFAYFSDIFGSFATATPTRDVRAGAILTTLLSALVDRERASAEEQRLSRSLSYINSYYSNPIQVSELAAMESLSPSRYSAIFRTVAGVSPIAYITALRMKHACTLLVSTNIDVGAIGRSVGYEDKHFFSKMFKKHIGVSAVEYRNKNRSDK